MTEDEATVERLSRVVIQGPSGSGKTTLAVELADILGVTALELDALYQQADWTPLELDEFRARVQEFIDQPKWVVDGNYSQVRDLVWSRATTIVFIDIPRRVTMIRVVRRTVSRLVRRERLWNDNHELWRNVVSRDPMRNIILWSWNSYVTYHVDVPREARTFVGSERVVVLSSTRDVRGFLDAARAAR